MLLLHYNDNNNTIKVIIMETKIIEYRDFDSKAFRDRMKKLRLTVNRHAKEATKAASQTYLNR